ncbi:MAG: hypothetical protein SFY92_00855 [Verrucomicrobiae bacterium]|nr:hypothetical protein [Verrucomicrobiae bacterium]
MIKKILNFDFKLNRPEKTNSIPTSKCDTKVIILPIAGKRQPEPLPDFIFAPTKTGSFKLSATSKYFGKKKI